jgi:competence protein ComEC
MNKINIMRVITCAAVILFSTLCWGAEDRDLQIFFVDVEGGAATLIVTPSGESLLADTGSPLPDDRDAKRIFSAAQAAGLKKLDYVLITHFDRDHSGGVPALSKLIHIGKYLDHGDSIETQAKVDAERWQAYVAASHGKRTTMKPGDSIPLKGVRLTVVSSNGEVLAEPMNGGKANAALCANPQVKEPDLTENARCLGFVLSFGKFKFLDLGDLTWDKEMALACPVNKLGRVSLYQATMHGFYNDRSGAPAHISAIQPQVVIVNNGPRKGLLQPAYERIMQIPGLEDVWQSHLSLANDAQHNTSNDKIANLEATAECRGSVLKVAVHADGRYTVTNLRNGFSKTYTVR